MNLMEFTHIIRVYILNNYIDIKCSYICRKKKIPVNQKLFCEIQFVCTYVCVFNNFAYFYNFRNKYLIFRFFPS